MMKYKLFLAAVVGCLCYSCGNEELIDDNESTKTEIGKDEILLSYSIDELAGQTYAVVPLPAEEKINSVFYIFQNTEGVVVASSYRDNLDDYQDQYLPIVIPKILKGYTGKLKIRIICNWESYLAKGVSIDQLHDNLKNQKEDYIMELTSLGFNLAPGEFTAEMPLLYTGTFDYEMGSNLANVQLNRKNVVFNVTFDSDAHFVPKTLTISNLSYSTYLFQEKAVAPAVGNARKYDVNVEAGKEVRVYALPNTKENVLKMDLKAAVEVPTRFNSANEDKIPGNFNPYLAPEKRDMTMSVNLAVENASSVYFSNQYVPIHLFSVTATQQQQQQQQLGYTVSSWPNGKFLGKYFRDPYGNGVAVTPTNLDFEFADFTPMRFFTNTTPAPTGAESREIFVSTHGTPNAWRIEASNIPEWLTIERHPTRSSILVSVEPNFTITPAGLISSVVRRYVFNVLFDGFGERMPIVITQKEAPSTPSDVYIGKMDSEPNNGVKVGIWLKDRYEETDKRNPALTANFYANTDGTKEGGVGDPYAIENVRQSGGRNGEPKWRFITNSYNMDKIPSPIDGHRDDANDEGSEDPTSIYFKCRSKDRKGYTEYQMIRIEEAAMLLFPRVRCREIWLNGRSALLYYVSDGTNICFINIVGIGYPPSFYSPSTRIYVDARGSKWRYNLYPDAYWDSGKYDRVALADKNLGSASRIYCYYGMEFSHSRRAIMPMVDGGGMTGNVLQGMMRCVRREETVTTK